jgi:acyl-CoA thioesterase FadM
MRYTHDVTEQECSTEGRDIAGAIQVHGGHLPFHLLLHRCQQTWFRFLFELTGFEGGLSTPHVEADLYSPIGVGCIDIEVTVEAIGNSSFTLRSEVFQGENRAAVARMVLVSFDYEREVPLALSSAQRQALEGHHPHA